MQIKDMAEGVNVRGHYLITRKELIPFSSKPGRFLMMQLADKTGEIRAIVWEQGEELAAQLATGDVIAVEGSGLPGYLADSVQFGDEAPARRIRP